jgi:hypothetical protein
MTSVFNMWTSTRGRAPESKLTVTGSVGIAHYTNRSEAIVQNGVLINQDAARWTAAQSVAVHAATTMDLINLAGVIQLNLNEQGIRNMVKSKGGRKGNSPFSLFGNESGMDEYVATEHLLLGLLGEYYSVAAQVLLNLGVNLERARAEVLHVLGATPSDSVAIPPRETDPLRAHPDLVPLYLEWAQIGLAKEAAVRDQEFRKAADLRDRELELIRRIDAIRRRLRRDAGEEENRER